MFTNTVAKPSLFEAVTVYVVRPTVSVGVPLMCPVVVSKTRPAGSSGAIDQVNTGPPVETGNRSTTLELLSNSTSLGMYSTTGRLSRTVM